jgi:hypothetical protein
MLSRLQPEVCTSPSSELEEAMDRANGLLQAALRRIAQSADSCGSTRRARAELEEILRCELRDRSVRIRLLGETLAMAERIKSSGAGRNASSSVCPIKPRTARPSALPLPAALRSA